jgi:hypothetical protein
MRTWQLLASFGTIRRRRRNQLRAEGDKMKDDFLRKPIRISAPFSPPREKGWG